MSTQERMARLEEKTDHIAAEVAELKDTMKNFIAAADKRYAAKPVERVVYGMTGAILLSVLYLILRHVGIE